MSTTTSESPARRAVVTTPTEREIRVERVFEAPRDRVWKAMTDRDLVAKWWGRGNPLTIEHHDVRPGGRWRFVEHDQGNAIGFEGEYREVNPTEGIVQTFGWDGMTERTIMETMTLEDLGDGRTKVVTVSAFHSADERDGMLRYGMEEGLNQSYAALDQVLRGLED